MNNDQYLTHRTLKTEHWKQITNLTNLSEWQWGFEVSVFNVPLLSFRPDVPASSRTLSGREGIYILYLWNPACGDEKAGLALRTALADYLKGGFDHEARSLTPQAGARDIYKIDSSSTSSSEWHFQWPTRLTFTIVYWSLIIVHWNRFAGTHPLANDLPWISRYRYWIQCITYDCFFGSSLQDFYRWGCTFSPGWNPGLRCGPSLPGLLDSHHYRWQIICHFWNSASHWAALKARDDMDWKLDNRKTR